MATIDAVMADKRAQDVMDKYRDRMHRIPADKPDGPEAVAYIDAVATEMQSDIANAINAAIAEVLAREPEVAVRTPVTHIPATGDHGGTRLKK